MPPQRRPERDLMRQLQQLQERMAQAQRALEETVVEASAGGGAVSVTMNAHPRLLSISIRPEAVDPDDLEMLQDLVLAAINEALAKVRAAQMQQVMGIAGGLGLGGLQP
jgi:DNA-binding YbaB/EbfC family protein